jgi:hypothetical protein
LALYEVVNVAEFKHAKSFISYRRQDSEDAAGRLNEELSECFGEGRVFFDVDSILVGVNYRRYLEDAASQCDVFFASSATTSGGGWRVQRTVMTSLASLRWPEVA